MQGEAQPACWHDATYNRPGNRRLIALIEKAAGFLKRCFAAAG